MIKAIIFDFFGVIHVATYPRWLNKHGLKKEGELAGLADKVDMGIVTVHEFFNTLHQLSGEPVESIRESFYEGRLIDEALITLMKKLKLTYKIGLLSNSNHDYIRPILEEGSIASLFDEIIISSEVGIIKPDIKIFRLTLDKMNIKAEQAIFIDDNETNVKAAASVGINSILYKDLASFKERLADLGITVS